MQRNKPKLQRTLRIRKTFPALYASKFKLETSKRTLSRKAKRFLTYWSPECKASASRTVIETCAGITRAPIM